MTTITIRFRNSNEEPIYLQVDPWAAVYMLKNGEEIQIAAESESGEPSFFIEEYNDTRILVIEDSTDYYLIVDGKRIHWSVYQSNL